MSGVVGGVNSDAVVRAALRSSMAAHLPELDATRLEKLVDFSIAQDINDRKDFERIDPASIASTDLNGLSFGLQSALIKYAKAM